MDLMRPQWQPRSVDMHIGIYLGFLQAGCEQLPPPFTSQITQARVAGVVEQILGRQSGGRNHAQSRRRLVARKELAHLFYECGVIRFDT